MKIIKGKEYVVTNDEEYYSCDILKSLEEVKEWVIGELGIEDDDESFFIGTPDHINLSIDTDDFYEALLGGYEDQRGEWSESWEDGLFDKESKPSLEIQSKLDEICALIHKEHPVNFWTVSNAQLITLDQLEEDK
ncbi:MAG: hypothetical protein ACTSRG_12930 [Candidatus Helarchaeota archaeon]